MRRKRWGLVSAATLVILVLYTSWSLVDLEISQTHRKGFYDLDVMRHSGSSFVPKDTDTEINFEIHQARQFITFYNISAPSNADFKCVNLRLKPVTPICIYDEWSDMYISHDLQETGLWEPQVVSDFQDVLRRDKSLGLIDVGANIGMYTLLAANMGHDVVAIEPFEESIHRLHKSAILAKTQGRIVVLKNAVSDRRDVATIRRSGNNQGDTRVVMGSEPCLGSCPKVVKTILLDDVRFVSSFQRAVLKIDSQGYENIAFQHASKLLDSIFIPYIYMEWLVMKEHYVSYNHTSHDKDLIENLVESLYARDYRPYRLDAEGATVLDRQSWQKWPNDVVWRHLPVRNEYTKLMRNHFLNWPQ